MTKRNRTLGVLVIVLLVVLGYRGGAQRRAAASARTKARWRPWTDRPCRSNTAGRPCEGATIFGGLVRYGDVWCPGADEATMLSTSRPLRMGQLSVPAGEYSLWILPTESAWTLILNKEAHTFHTNYRGSRDLGRVAMQKQTLSAPVEQLTFAIERNSSGPGGRLVMTWATTEVSVPFLVGD